MNSKIYYLFGSEAAEMYNDWTSSEQQLLEVFIEDSLDYGLFVYDELNHHPSDLLSAYDGWGDFAQITESFYNLLKTQ